MTANPTPVPSWVPNRRDSGWRCDPPSTAVREFHRSLAGYRPTPLVDVPALAAELGVGRVLVKDESDRLGLPAFKALGASWAVHRVVSANGTAGRRLTLVAATDGNHGRAVARFARLLGHRSSIFIPTGVHPTAIQAIRDENAAVTVVDGSYDDTVERAAQAANAPDAVLVQDTAWDGYEQIPSWIVEGYDTLFGEIDDQLAAIGLSSPDLVAVPTGVGSLLQAALTHYRSRAAQSGTAVVSVEPKTAACVTASLIAGRPVTVETTPTAMAGLNCGTVSHPAWPLISNGLDAAITITEAADIRAAHDLAALGIPAGPCGAAPLAALRAALTGPGCAERREHLGIEPDSTVVLLSTEGSSSNPVPDQAVLQINSDRLWGTLMELKEIGAYDDAATGLRGVKRLALTDEDDEARRLVVSWMRDAGMSVRVDEIGNVYAVRPGRDRSLPCVLMGSHIDTVATGGAFDGTLGVLGAIEVVRTLNEAGIDTLRDIECGFFTEEEGVRFGTDMLGSAVTAGRIPLDHAHALTDADGLTVAEELVRTGWNGDAYHRRPIPHAYIECHIEQGPILAGAGVDVGIVTGVQSISWQRLTVHGEAAHAGTTPIEHRHDAGLVAAQVIVELRRMCDSGEYGQLRATIGNLTLEPAQTNVIPHTATLTIDLRNPMDDSMTSAEKDLERFVSDLAARSGVRVAWERMAKTAVIPFHDTIQRVLAETADDLGLGYVKAMSGAGHDAQEIAAICPTAMVFVAGEYGGISHTPREYSNPRACANGTNLLANAVLRLANEEAVTAG